MINVCPAPVTNNSNYMGEGYWLNKIYLFREGSFKTHNGIKEVNTIIIKEVNTTLIITTPNRGLMMGWLYDVSNLY